MATTLQQIRSLPGSEQFSDDELYNNAKNLGIEISDYKPPEEAGAFRSYVGLPFLKGVSDIGGAVGYGLEAIGLDSAGRALQESNQRVQENLTARQSQAAQADAQKPLIDENGNYGGYNFGSLVQDVTGAIPGTFAMGMAGAPLAKVASIG